MSTQPADKTIQVTMTAKLQKALAWQFQMLRVASGVPTLSDQVAGAVLRGIYKGDKAVRLKHPDENKQEASDAK